VNAILTTFNVISVPPQGGQQQEQGCAKMRLDELSSLQSCINPNNALETESVRNPEALESRRTGGMLQFVVAFLIAAEPARYKAFHLEDKI
jgi:hypothetical protein